MGQQLIAFLKSAWGYLTIGTSALVVVITLLVIFIRAIKVFKASQSSFLSIISGVVKHQDDNAVVQATNTAQTEYFAEVQSAIFKLLSYIVMASKMTQDDKITLLNSIKGIDSTKYKELFDKAYTELKGSTGDVTVPEADVPKVVETIVETVEVATSLLDKYVN